MTRRHLRVVVVDPRCEGERYWSHWESFCQARADMHLEYIDWLSSDNEVVSEIGFRHLVASGRARELAHRCAERAVLARLASENETALAEHVGVLRLVRA